MIIIYDWLFVICHLAIMIQKACKVTKKKGNLQFFAFNNTLFVAK